MPGFYQISGFPPITPQLDRIPVELKALPCAVWIAEPRQGQVGKYNKAPRSPLTGNKIGANNPSNFGTFQQAEAALATGEYSGFGVLPTGGIVGIDIDYYEDEFERNPSVRAFVLKVQQAGAYCEKSPSGKGLRIFLRGKLPGKGRKVGALEIYDRDRFLTVTGKSTRSAQAKLIDGQELVDEFLSLLPVETTQARVADVGHAPSDPIKVGEICSLVASVRSALWEGIWKDHLAEYVSQSEADMALIGEITRKAVAVGVRTETLADTIEQVFTRSGLYREEKILAVRNHAIPKAIAGVIAHKTQATQAAQGISDTEAGAELLEHAHGDILAGKQFARAMRQKMLYAAPAGKWLHWNGFCWSWCGCSEEMAAAKRVAGKVLDHATTLFKSDPEKHKKLHAFASGLQNIRRLEAMIELAKSEEGMSVSAMTDLDNNPWLLGVRNGVINLKDGGLLAPDPKMRMTRQCAAEYHDDAECPRWLTFLDQIFEGDQETIAFIQRSLGYTLTGTTTEEVLFICVGFGANGKSVFSNVIGTIMADYSRAAPSSLLTVRRADDSGPRNDLAMLCGARMVSINETQTGDRLDEQIVKTLAGRETISARFLHKEFFDFRPTAKPWLRTNHRPIITGEDDGIWRRILLIPFRRKFAEQERDPWLESKLLEERDGILAWMVRGGLDWQRNGLRPSPMIRRESVTYRKESDLMGEFLDDKTQDDNDSRIEQAALFFEYRTWHEQNGTRAGSKTSFTRKLKERGFAEAKSNGKRYYSGLKHKEPSKIIQGM